MKVNQNNNQKQLRVGYSQFRVVMFNPSRQELNKLLGKEDSDDDKEIEYVKESTYSYGTEDNKVEKDVTQANVTVWLQEVGTDKYYPLTFSLKDHVQYTGDGNKTCFVNQFGKSFYADEQANLPEWFTHLKSKRGTFEKQVRPALVGERELLEFLKNWLNLDEFNMENNFFELPLKNIFKGNFKFLNSEFLLFMNKDLVVLPLTVGTKEKDGVTEEVQRLGKYSLNNKYYPQLNALVNKFKEDDSKPLNKHFESLENKYYDIKQFVSNMFSEYQKDYFVLEIAREYNPEENQLNQASALVNETSADY